MSNTHDKPGASAALAAATSLAGIEAFTKPPQQASFSLKDVRDERSAEDLLEPLAIKVDETTYFRGVGEQSETLFEGKADYAIMRVVQVRSNDPESLKKGQLLTIMAVVDIVGKRTDERCSADTKNAGPVLWSASGLIRMRRTGGSRTQVALQIRGPGAPSVKVKRDNGEYNDPHPLVKDQFATIERAINFVCESQPEFGKAWIEACSVSDPASKAGDAAETTNMADAVKSAKDTATAAEAGKISEDLEV